MATRKLVSHFKITQMATRKLVVHFKITQMLAFECQPKKHIDPFWPITPSGSLAPRSSRQHKEQSDVHFERCLTYVQSLKLSFLSLVGLEHLALGAHSLHPRHWLPAAKDTINFNHLQKLQSTKYIVYF